MEDGGLFYGWIILLFSFLVLLSALSGFVVFSCYTEIHRAT